MKIVIKNTLRMGFKRNATRDQLNFIKKSVIWPVSYGFSYFMGGF